MIDDRYQKQVELANRRRLERIEREAAAKRLSAEIAKTRNDRRKYKAP